MSIAMPGPPFIFSILYVWSRRFPEVPISFFGSGPSALRVPWGS